MLQPFGIAYSETQVVGTGKKTGRTCGQRGTMGALVVRGGDGRSRADKERGYDEASILLGGGVCRIGGSPALGTGNLCGRIGERFGRRLGEGTLSDGSGGRQPGIR